MKRFNVALLVGLLVVVLATMIGVVVVHRFQLWRNAGGMKRLAAQRLAEGRRDDALILYSRYMAMRPDDADAGAEYAKLVLDRAQAVRGRVDLIATYKLAEDALRKKPDDRDLRFKLARFLLNAGNGAEARDHLLTLRSGIPEGADGQTAAAGDGAAAGAGAGAGDTGAVESAPPDHQNPITVDIMLAKAETAMGKFEEGLATAARMIGFDLQTRAFVDDAPAVPGTGDSYLIVATILAERFRDQATGDRVMGRLVEALPNDPMAWLARARWNRQFGNLDAATADLDTALSLASDNPDILFAAFEVALAKREYDKAKGYIEESMDLFQQDEKVVRGRAVLAMQQQQHDRAIEVLEEGLRTRPDNPAFLTMLIDTFFATNRIEDAAKAIARLREVVGADHAAVGMYEARTLMARQEWNDARRRLDAVRPLVAQSEELTRQVDLLLGQCFDRLGQFDQQAEANRRVLQDSPESFAARIGVASALQAAGRRDEALAEFEAISRSFPADRLPSAPQIWKPLLELRIQKQLQRPVAERDWTEADSVVAMLRESSAITDSQLALLQAEVLIQKGEIDSAIDLLQRARDSAPDDPLLAVGLTKSLAQSSRIIEAQAVVESLPPEIRNSAGVLGAEIRVAQMAKADEARELLARIERDSDKLTALEAADVLSGVAAVHAGSGREEEAERIWQRVLEKSPNDVRIRSSLMESALDQGNVAKVRQYATALVNVSEPDSPQTRVAKAAVLIVGALKARRDGEDQVADINGSSLDAGRAVEEARAMLLEAESARPGWPLIQQLFADVSNLQGDVPGAIGRLREALSRGASNPNVATKLAAMLYDTQQLDEARSVLARLGGLASRGVERITAEILLRDGRKDEAVRLAREAVPDDSTQPDSFLWLGRLLARCGQGTASENALRRAAELAPTRGELWIELVGLQIANGHRAEAERTLEQALESIAPERRDQFSGLGYEVLGQNETAERYYRAAVATHADDVVAARALADFLVRRGRVNEARSELERICALPAEGSTADVKRWARRMIATLAGSNATFRTLEKATSLLEQNVGDDGKRSPEDLELLVGLLSDRPEPACWRRSIELLGELRRQKPLSLNHRILQAQLHDKLGDWEACRRDLIELVSTPSSPPWLYTILIELLISHGEMESARTWLQKLQSLAGGSPMALALEAKLADAMNDRDRAIAAARQLMPEGPVGPEQGPQLAMVAKLLEELNFPKAADKVLTQYAEMTPQGGLARAEFLGRQGRPAEAFDVLETLWDQVAVERFLQSAVNVFRSAPDGLDVEQRQRLDRWFEKAKRQDPGSVRIAMVEALLQETEGRLAEAEDTYRKILSRPDVAPIHSAVVANNLAFLKAHPDTVDEARRLIDSAILELGPHPDLLDTRGLVWLAAGETNQAIIDITESVLTPSPAKYLHLALAQLKAQQTEEARVSLEKARELGLDEKKLSPDDRQRLQMVEEAVSQPVGA